MDQSTITRLNQLNIDFYRLVAKPFSDSRQQGWEGWQTLFSRNIFTKKTGKKLKVLDVGCGNGRFGVFLADVLGRENIEYWGLDQNAELLDIARTQLDEKLGNYQLREIDIINQIDFVGLLPQTSFDVITIFGVMHHLPSFEVREKLFSRLFTLLAPEGKIIFTTWNFLDNPRLKNKIIDPQVIGIDSQKLETNDFVLDWQAGKTAYRYCHYYDEDEIAQLLGGCYLKITEQFLADGQDHQTNHYYVVSPA